MSQWYLLLSHSPWFDFRWQVRLSRPVAQGKPNGVPRAHNSTLLSRGTKCSLATRITTSLVVGDLFRLWYLTEFLFHFFFQCKLHYHHHHDSQEPHTSVLWALRFKTRSSSLTSCLTWSRNFNCRTRPMIINLSRWKSGAQYLLIHAPKLILNGQKRKSWYVNQLNGQVSSG